MVAVMILAGAGEGTKRRRQRPLRGMQRAVLGPAAQPDFPVAEARADRHWCFQAQELRFRAHRRDIFMAPTHRTVKSSAALFFEHQLAPQSDLRCCQVR